jgi:hypothetical protein
MWITWVKIRKNIVVYLRSEGSMYQVVVVCEVIDEGLLDTEGCLLFNYVPQKLIIISCFPWRGTYRYLRDRPGMRFNFVQL